MTDTTIDLKEINKNISKAKLRLMLSNKTTFFSALLANLKIEITTDISTACTDGVSLQLNPHFIQNFDKETLLGLLLHEVMHVALDHINLIAYKSYDQKTLNIAMDYYINLYITGLKYKIPEGGYCDSKFINMSTMQIYAKLIENPPPDMDTFELDVLGCPEGVDPQEHNENVTSNIVKAVIQAQLNNDQGSVPGELLRQLEDVLNPQLPWQTILANYMDSYAKDEYSFRRPNKRFMPDFYLPTLYSQSLKQITTGCDVSGSMSEEDISEIFSEIQYIWDTLQPTTMRLQTFDTKVHLNAMFNQGDTLDQIELKGGGGTNVQPLLNSIRKEEPAFALIFTDGYFSTPNMNGIYTDVFWIIKGNPGFKAPHGVIIPFD